MLKENLFSYLKCPNGHTDLKFHDDELHSQEFSYPIINGIPWLFQEPEESFMIWATKISNYISEEDSNIASLKTILGLEKNALTKTRLKKTLCAKIKNLDQFKTTLELFNGHEPLQIESSSQQIHSYFKLIFRDWCWGQEELNIYTEYISNHSDFNNKKVLILGAGACGLSFKLAVNHPSSDFYSVEHNPFLAFTANNIINGITTSLSEHTPYPINIEMTSKDWDISNTEKISNHQIILGSFPQLPFHKDAFDVVICPWFLDILDTCFSDSLAHAKSFLKTDGSFHFIGPANIHKNDYTDQLTRSEILHVFQTEFKNISSEQKFINYMNSPLDSQKRSESVLFITGMSKQVNESSHDEIESKNDDTIKFTPQLKQYKLVNDTFNRILKHVSGDIKYSDLAMQLEKEFGFSTKESLHYARTFIKKINHEVFNN
jgi:hypothetical protein